MITIFQKLLGFTEMISALVCDLCAYLHYINILEYRLLKVLILGKQNQDPGGNYLERKLIGLS